MTLVVFNIRLKISEKTYVGRIWADPQVNTIFKRKWNVAMNDTATFSIEKKQGGWSSSAQVDPVLVLEIGKYIDNLLD
jgi:hypothetical protein